ncbi:hypothetical protein D4764_19G0005500 [Takifugu flavidus]|uniref:Uncharacterized protein n=1 Tax=Takifugu flavidus TaxID=433684 RepID=A0A5C6NME9_9TELE|nr:hypothetical protein D4764_19G0005500 [Takifugu flavidus]
MKGEEGITVRDTGDKYTLDTSPAHLRWPTEEIKEERRYSYLSI